MKYRNSLLTICIPLLAFIVSPGFQCSQYRPLIKAAKVPQIMHDVEVLANDSLEGRGTATPGELKAANYLSGRFKSLGLAPKGEIGTYFQVFSFKPHPAVQLHQVGDSTSMGMALVNEIIGRNVIGYLDNKSKTTIIIGAHFDHLGYGDENSLHSGGKAIHNGADDNASGVACMLELARRIAVNPTAYKHNNYLFIAFSGEEKGLWGSNYFCKNPTVDITTVNYMLNMDMVGRLNAAKALAVNGVGTSPLWMEILPGIQQDGIAIVTSESGVGPSDHTSFYNTGIPVLHFFTGQHEDYHKPSDDADKINYTGITSVTGFIDQVIRQLDNRGKLEFVKTKDESPTATDFKVTLGVVPDYLFDGEGMRIDGTRENRPAAKAGMKQGDIVVQIGENIVGDMYSYMEALGKYSKGEITDVILVRNGERITLKVTWD